MTRRLVGRPSVRFSLCTRRIRQVTTATSRPRTAGGAVLTGATVTIENTGMETCVRRHQRTGERLQLIRSATRDRSSAGFQKQAARMTVAAATRTRGRRLQLGALPKVQVKPSALLRRNVTGGRASPRRPSGSEVQGAIVVSSRCSGRNEGQVSSPPTDRTTTRQTSSSRSTAPRHAETTVDRRPRQNEAHRTVGVKQSIDACRGRPDQPLLRRGVGPGG